ncbi:MAG: sigma-54-dependent Fis family transcriptional regulator, partial [Myxococcales bacterium]|nr:sigma-54-dependent Fis family transcriptional regulator [Myxococcales bacterium]
MTSTTGRVLVVDDDESMRAMLEQGLSSIGHQVVSCGTVLEALEIIERQDPEVLLTDLRLGGESGLDVCTRAMERSPRLPVVVMTGFGSMETAIAAIRAGAYDFVNKPVELLTLEMILSRAIRRRRLLDEVQRLREDSARAHDVDLEMIGESRSMRRLFDMIDRLRDSDATVLINGESGTGKELVARALHKSSGRRDGPFVAINCAAVPAELLESELFGHVRGAFTDARRAREGLFARANGGTLLLDEIGEMPLEMQPKLLRALQERRVRPLGANSEVEINVRLLAATNRDLESMIEEGEFREDLYYRVNVVQLRVPPLRSRGNDVLQLAQFFIDRIRERDGKPVQALSPSAAACLSSYDWPGNVRELEN